MGYELIKQNCRQAKESRWVQPMPAELLQREARPRNEQVDVIVIDFMKTFMCPQFVVKEILFKDQLGVRICQVFKTVS